MVAQLASDLEILQKRNKQQNIEQVLTKTLGITAK